MKQLRHFYSKSFLLVLFTALIFLYVVTVFLAYRHIEFSERERKKQVIGAQQAEFENLSKEEKALKKAQEYLVQNVSAVKIEQRLILDYLQRKFDLNDKLSAQASPFVIPENHSTYPQEINFLARIAYPDNLVRVDEPRNAVDGPLLTNIYSANCDHIPLPSSYWPTIEENYRQGGYYLTHNGLAFAFMKDNGCEIPPDKQDLVEKVIQGMVQIVANKDAVADLRYEAAALLLLSGKYGLIEQPWIDEIIANQLDDGGWAEKKGEPNASDHATVLAFWVLLEYSRPNTPEEPLILRPTSST